MRQLILGEAARETPNPNISCKNRYDDGPHFLGNPTGEIGNPTGEIGNSTPTVY